VSEQDGFLGPLATFTRYSRRSPIFRCEGDLTTTRADLFSVDIDTLTWTEHTNVSDGIGRIEPSMAIVDRDRPYLCVFGGRSGPEFLKGPTERSFCVMRLEPDRGQWEWHVRQGEPASDIVFGSQGGAVPTKRGVLVLLGKSAPEIKDVSWDLVLYECTC